ncbi:hypothetical protein NE865_07056 [Phthorimaea operculella]|nr:hypothetical protein NE865_07056 [Phthorimaea operculella]
MSESGIEDHSGDEEFFFGPFTMQEARKHLIPLCHRQTVGYCINAEPKQDTNTSLKLIETHSAPDVSPKGDLNSPTITKSESSPGLSPDTVASDWDIKPDDSFLRLEKMVSEMCMSSEKSSDLDQSESKKYFFTQEESSTNKNETDKQAKDKNKIENYDNQVSSTTEDEPKSTCKTPAKNNYSKYTLKTPKQDIFKTPSSELKTRTPVFKTPGNPTSNKKLITPRKYQNVASPVATYIRNSPQIPLLKDVYPKKPLPGVSSIPKLSRQIPRPNVGNKENLKQEKVKVVKAEECIKLPAVAYRNAKETKVIDVPDVTKMPQNNWAKQVASSIPRAMVARHNYREASSAKKPLQSRQEDSFGDLSLHQADLSVCTQKSTFTMPRKNI